MSETTDGALRALVDKEEIREVLRLYCRAFDRWDWELARSLFHPDAHDDHGVYQGSALGLIEHAESILKTWESHQHSLGTVIVELDGDVAHTEAYFVARSLRKGPEGDGEIVSEMYGRYVDRFERRDGAWKIARRTTVLDFRDSHERLPVDAADAQFTQGRRDRSDAAYQRS
ncbi:MAG: nuclear transport factor 2 family protein [Acidimicrobiia bacterium]